MINVFCLQDVSQLSCACQPLSAAAILQIHLVTEGSSTSSVGYMRTDMFQWLLPPPTPPTSSRGPSAPALSHYVGEMFGGLSVPSCRTVSKHNASQRAPQLLRHTVCFCVCVCQCVEDLLIHRIPFLLYFFSDSSKTMEGRGWLLQSGGCLH